MDIARPDVKRKKEVRRITYIAVAMVLIPLVTYALSKLKPAAPTVDWGTVWPDTVKRGPMVIEVRGLGILVPENIVIVPAATDGRVEKRNLLPGNRVKPDTVILVLSNPELEQSAADAEFQLKGAAAELSNLKAQLQNQLMALRATAAGVSSDYNQAKLQADTNAELFKNGLIADVNYKLSQVRAEQLARQNEIAQQQVETFAQSMQSQIAAQQTKVDAQKALAQLKRSQVAQLQVRAGIEGVLQELDVEVGQKATQGTALARVAQPSKLKAQLRIPETQAKDVLIGQKAAIDTHNGVIPGHVTRIDPAVVNGTVTVDASLDGPLPTGARPDLSVEGTIEIERLADVVYVGRPVHGEPNSTIGLFKVSSDQKEAVRVQVALGRVSVNAVEIVKGLQVGDQVVLSDMSAWDNFDRIQLRH